MGQPAIEPLGPDEPATDRRRLRTERGKELVVDALLTFFAEGDPQPGVAKIAARAGVSERSVFRYFDDLESLAGAAIERQIARIAPAFRPPAPTGDLEARIGALVEQRLRIYDATAVTTQAAERFAPHSPAIAQAFAFRRSVLHDQIAELFTAELTPMTGRVRREVIDAVSAAASLETIRMLRTTADHSRARTAAIINRTLRALLTT
ncbi:MAG: TetR/AcrR family transcriptional regulator [Acidimicrobiia bacterium]